MEHGKEFNVAVMPEITTNDMALMIKLAIAGAGVTSVWKKKYLRDHRSYSGTAV
ncbi:MULTISPECIES: hypothetical protein [Rhizobium]|uniref:hypothetical protein n=1 Tax=Rhizobium sp. SEMIA 4085 TaxID=2137761 RepID=UPI000B1079BB|nr:MULTISPECIES: hypothetical protein [Rhizobium]